MMNISFDRFDDWEDKEREWEREDYFSGKEEYEAEESDREWEDRMDGEW